MIRRSWPRDLRVYAGIEVFGASVGIAGIAVEFGFGAHFGFILVTSGAVAYGIGTSLWTKLFVRTE